MYLLIFTLTPFVISNKFHDNKLAFYDILVIILIAVYISTIGADYKLEQFKYPGKIIPTVIILILIFIWLLFDFTGIEKEQKDFFKKKRASNRIHLDEEPPLPADDMEVDNL